MKARFFALMALVLGLASCQTDMVDGVKVDANGEAAVTLQVGLPQDATRADSALGAIDNQIDMDVYDIRFILAVYDKDGNLAKGPMVTHDDATEASFSFRLVPGRKYHFVAWADFVLNGSADDLHYNTDEFPVVSLMDGDAQNLNDESRDAYTQVVTVDNFSGASSIPQMVLTRPFAKLRVITTDMDQLYTNLKQSTVTYTSKVYTSFNALDSKVYGDADYISAKTVEYTADKDDYYRNYVYGAPANGEMTLFADYLFGGVDDRVMFSMYVEDYTTNVIPTIEFNTNIPVQRNHLTTIYGPVLTDANNITVVIDDNFAKPDHVVDIWDGESKEEITPSENEEGETEYVVNSAAELAWLADFVNGLTASTFATRAGNEPVHFVLNADIDLDNMPWTPIGFNPNEEAGNENYFTGTFDGNGHEIRNLYIDVKDKGGVGLFGAVNNATIKNLTLRNVFVKAVESENDPANSSGAEGKTNYIVGGHIGAVAGYDAAPYGTGSVKFENVHVAGLIKIEAETRAAQGQRVGGIIGGRGYSKITFNNVSVIGEEGSYIKGYCSTAGVIGQGLGVSTFNGVTTNIPVYAVTFGAGGISGIACNGSTFTNCKSEGNVTLDASKTQLSSYSANYPFRVGGIAGCWSDSKTGVLTLTNCSYEGNLISIDKDGNSPKAFDYAGYVGRGYALKNCAGSKVIIDGVEYVQKYDSVYGVYTINGLTPVATADELVAALEANEGVLFMNDIKIEPATMSNAYGATGINVKNCQTIDGNGYTLNIKGAGGTWDSGINTTGGIIKNLTVTGSFRGIFINHTSEHSEKVVLENVTIGGNGTVYTISCDQGLYQGIEATNCTFNGWTSFAKTAGEAKFVNCNFGEGSGYKYCRPYSNTEFVGCTFCPGYAVDTTRATVTFTDCTWEE